MSRRRTRPQRQEVDVATLQAIVARTAHGPLPDAERALLGAVVDTLAQVTAELAQQGVSIRRLRQLLFGASTEKSATVLAGLGGGADEAAGDRAADEAAAPGAAGGERPARTPGTGHGRNGAETLRAAERVVIAHGALRHGDRCPGCQRGNLSAQAQPKQLVRIRAVAPITATVYECERLRGGACGEIVTAQPPPGIGEAKSDESVAAMIALLKYGCGLPFSRIAKLQRNLGIPVPATTQWELVHRAAEALGGVLEALCGAAAGGEVVHNDDTTMTILGFDPAASFDPVSDGERAERRGVYTSGIVAQAGGQQIALFFTGRRHAGENLARLLARREQDRPPPIQMCDGLAHNTAGAFETLVANCLAHARRKFVDVAVDFPHECRHVIEELREIYRVDAHTGRAGMSAEERLACHQRQSGPRMAALKTWLDGQLAERRVEPNSGAGDAIRYMLRHWERLTLFLREPGAPLDNNICERALKTAILHRKNALFYKTQNGARVGDLSMSLIHSAELARADPFDYLLQLLGHRAAVAAAPSEWMPWNYRETLAGRATRAP